MTMRASDLPPGRTYQGGEGYLTIATGKRKYLEIAVNLALSIRHNDPSRPICLLTDSRMKIPEAYRLCFDNIVTIGDDALLVGCANKMFMFDKSPYERTLFVDADCFLVKDDIDYFWKMFRTEYHFTVEGEVVQDGQWGQLDIGECIRLLKLPYMITCNSGVIYFDRSGISRSVIARIGELFNERRDELTWIHRDVTGQYADEPIICMAMAAGGLSPFPYYIDGKCLMLATPGGANYNVDVMNGISVFDKGPYNVSPTIFHCGGLHPIKIYLRESRKLRLKFGLPVLPLYRSVGADREFLKSLLFKVRRLLRLH